MNMTQRIKTDARTAQMANTSRIFRVFVVSVNKLIQFILENGKQTGGIAIATVWLAGTKDESRHDGTNTHQIKQRRLFVTRIGWFLAWLENVRFKPLNPKPF